MFVLATMQTYIFFVLVRQLLKNLVEICLVLRIPLLLVDKVRCFFHFLSSFDHL